MANSVGRNDICPYCDSGKKYKVCCLPEKKRILADMRAGAQYVRGGDGPFGVTKISQHGATSSSNTKLPGPKGSQ